MLQILFWMKKAYYPAELHVLETYLDMWGHSKGKKKIFYSQIIIVMIVCSFIAVVLEARQKRD